MFLRRKEKEIRNKDEIEAMLRNGEVCRIGLCDGNIPYVIPINYAYHDGCLYFHSASEGKKIDIIRKNNIVCFELDIMHQLVKTDVSCHWGVKYESVIGFGKAFFVEANDEKAKTLDLIMRHYDKENSGQEKSYEYNEAMVKRVTIIKIEISEMTGKRA